MKKINDLKSERSAIIEQMEVLTNGEALTEEQRTEWSNHDNRIKSIDDEISLLERQEELNKTNIKKMENTIETPKHNGAEFREFLVQAIDGNGPKKFELRVDPMLASSNTTIINKTVADSVDVLVSPAEAFLRQLGVTFYPGLTGNFVVPSMDQDTATQPGEGVAGADASMNIASLTLAAVRSSHSQTMSRETLAQTNPAIFTNIKQNLLNGLWNDITNKLFDNIDSDAATQISTMGTTLTYADLVNAEASIGGLNIGAGAYVTTPSGKAFMKKTIALGTTAGPAIWTDNEVNGYPAYGVPAANANKVYFGDFSRVALGIWGTPVVIVDEVTKAKEGEIGLKALLMADSGVVNKKAFCIKDASFA